jgi:hypothetical protein
MLRTFVPDDLRTRHQLGDAGVGGRKWRHKTVAFLTVSVKGKWGRERSRLLYIYIIWMLEVINKTGYQDTAGESQGKMTVENWRWRSQMQAEFEKNLGQQSNSSYTKTLLTNKCTKRVLSSIVTHSYMFRPCWVIFRENFFVIVTLRLHFIVERECAVDCVLRCFWRRELTAVLACTAVSPRLQKQRSTQSTAYDKTLFVHFLVISVFV